MATSFSVSFHVTPSVISASAMEAPINSASSVRNSQLIDFCSYEDGSFCPFQNFVKPLLGSGWLQNRKTTFGYSNPREWGFSMFNIRHILRNICAYAQYFIWHKASKPNAEELAEHLPEAGVSQLMQLSKAPDKGIQVLWIGHASLLVQIDGVNILFDPVFHDCGPVLCGYLVSGYKRFRPPAITVHGLKNIYKIEIHAVCISHNHYDHLDRRSVDELVEAYGDRLQWFVPKGMHQWFNDRGCKEVNDMEWWGSSQVVKGNSNCTITFTPAKHWSLRGIRDYYCRHLWGSWFIHGPQGSRFFFAGDTGYVQDLFKGIRDRCGKPDVAAIPIGAYKPRPVMCAQHMDPSEALQVHIELCARYSIGIHWGTFAMSNEKIHEPRQDLQGAKTAVGKESAEEGQGNNLDNFILLDHGEVRLFSRL